MYIAHSGDLQHMDNGARDFQHDQEYYFITLHSDIS